MPERPPNILWYCTDQQRFDTIGALGKLHLAQARSGIEPRVDDGYRFFRYSHSPRDNWPPGEHHYADWLRDRDHDARALLGDTRDPDYLSLVKERSFGGLYAPSADHDNVPPALHQTTWCTEMSIEFIQAARPADQP